ncbi:MAG: OmpA family protein [Pseudomonadota bacterium]
MRLCVQRAIWLLLLIASANLGAQELRDTLFRAADAAREAAIGAEAEALAPRTYERASKAFADAEEALERGRNISTVRDRIARAEGLYRDATESAELARASLAGVIKTRQDARKADAPTLSKPIWDDAEVRFATAVREMEKGDIKGAERAKREAESLYRDAELGAIKTRYLSDTRRLLADADRAKVSRYAPATLAKARGLLQDAERELNENRYDTDLPRSLAQQANYEARHAIYLAELVRNVGDKRMTTEDLILAWEKPLIDIAGAADIVPDLAAGPADLSAELTTLVEDLIASNRSLEQDLGNATTRVTEMQEEIRLLDEQLGGASQERQALMQRLQQEERVREQFTQVEQLFTRDEAQVFRNGNDVTLRLVGLNFASGSAEIASTNYPLLEKVQRAIGVFPRSDLIVEGHTDSYGSDETNLALSQSRAEALMAYMVASMRVPTSRLTAIGYGETQPVANNETADGRAKNRRIDIVIRPKF